MLKLTTDNQTTHLNDWILFLNSCLFCLMILWSAILLFAGILII